MEAPPTSLGFEFPLQLEEGKKSLDGGNTDGGDAVLKEAGLFMLTHANSVSRQEHVTGATAAVGHWFVFVTYSNN